MTKTHWTQTPEGKKRMSEIQKLAHKVKNGARVKRKYAKRNHGIIVTIQGKDAGQALSELVSNVAYDNLRVRITVERN